MESCTATATMSGKMVASMKVTIKTIKSMVEEPTPGKTGESTMESGSTESSMELVLTFLRREKQKKKGRGKESGLAS